MICWSYPQITRGELVASTVMQASHWTSVVVAEGAVYKTMLCPNLHLRSWALSHDWKNELLWVKRSWLRWFWHLIRMPPGPLPSGHVQMEGCIWMVYIQHISSGLGTSLYSPEGALMALLGRGMTGISCSACCIPTGSWMSERKCNNTEIMNYWTRWNMHMVHSYLFILSNQYILVFNLSVILWNWNHAPA